MIFKDQVRKDYHDWLVRLTGDWCADYGQFDSLLNYLYSREFVYTIDRDENRAADGIDFRLRFTYENSEYTTRDVYLYLTEPCNMLEMLAALACRCEDSIMDDPDIGDRSGVWFYTMLTNLHLNKMDDIFFDEMYVENVITDFLDHKYAKNGDGGLFVVNNDNVDMRTNEIWYQMNWFLSENFS